MAANKYGYKCRHSMRSVDEGVTAIKDGIQVLGFGFMDIEELGKLGEPVAEKVTVISCKRMETDA